ncbi:MAG: PDZ domain-containing protein [Candidatus Niyogibacteria bacterium]|nr:PDZ domain-containing protein [Candidatus Niyogibacteria bacterium]
MKFWKPAVKVAFVVFTATFLAQFGIARAATIVEAKFNEQWRVIQKYSVREIPDTPEAKRECFEKVLRGGISMCLDDRHSVYYSAEDMRNEDERTNGQFSGIGATLTLYSGQVAIDYLMDGSPAALSGKIESGDIIMAVDGEDVHEKTITYIVSKIRGTEGTNVAVTFKRGGKLLAPIVLKRAKIELPSVETAKIDERTMLIKVNAFEQKTHLAFAKAVFDAVSDERDNIDPSKRFVIDLRDNPGGLLKTVQLMAAMFASSSDGIVLVEKKRNSESIVRVGDIENSEDVSFLNTAGGVFAQTRTVVLVNEHSASASEIFSGILQQWGRAKVVGVRTYGKGSVQVTISLRSGDGLHITIAEYLVGEKRVKVNGIGIMPDVFVENALLCGDEAKTLRGKKKPLVDLSRDAQLRAALEVLNGK